MNVGASSEEEGVLERKKKLAFVSMYDCNSTTECMAILAVKLTFQDHIRSHIQRISFIIAFVSCLTYTTLT